MNKKHQIGHLLLAGVLCLGCDTVEPSPPKTQSSPQFEMTIDEGLDGSGKKLSLESVPGASITVYFDEEGTLINGEFEVEVLGANTTAGMLLAFDSIDQLARVSLDPETRGDSQLALTSNDKEETAKDGWVELELKNGRVTGSFSVSTENGSEPSATGSFEGPFSLACFSSGAGEGASCDSCSSLDNESEACVALMMDLGLKP